MNDQTFIQSAIDVASDSGVKGGLPIGVVIVKDEQIVAASSSHVGSRLDPTAHGECECMKHACIEFQTLDLSDFTLYSTLEPCSMCLACASWCGIERIVFGAYKEDVPQNPYEIGNYHAEEHAKKLTPFGGGQLVVKGGILREECATLMANVVNWTPHE